MLYGNIVCTWQVQFPHIQVGKCSMTCVGIDAWVFKMQFDLLLLHRWMYHSLGDVKVKTPVLWKSDVLFF
jgi:hypothetical protein